jgi:hypothetical protein
MDDLNQNSLMWTELLQIDTGKLADIQCFFFSRNALKTVEMLVNNSLRGYTAVGTCSYYRDIPC